MVACCEQVVVVLHGVVENPEVTAVVGRVEAEPIRQDVV